MPSVDCLVNALTLERGGVGVRELVQSPIPPNPNPNLNVDVEVRGKETFDLQEDLTRLERTILALGVLDHHVAFVEDCVRESVYPLGLRAFVPCAVFRSNNALKKQWKQILHATSLEPLALCRTHYKITEVEIKKELAELSLRGESLKGEDRIEWKMRECNA